MLCWLVLTQADLRQVQPIVCTNCSDTPVGLLQSLRNLFSDKAFASGIDAANPDKDGLFGRSFGPLCDNLGSEEIELVQHRQITAQTSSTIRLLLGSAERSRPIEPKRRGRSLYRSRDCPKAKAFPSKDCPDSSSHSSPTAIRRNRDAVF